MLDLLDVAEVRLNERYKEKNLKAGLFKQYDSPLYDFDQKSMNDSVEGGKRMEYISAKAASEKYDVTPRWIQKLCEDGKIEGAMKLEGSDIWLIPKDAEIVLERKNRQIESE